MAVMIVLTVLAGFGALCVLWAIFGAWLPGYRGTVMICLCRCGEEEAVIRRYRWLRGMGLLRCPLVLVGSTLSQEELHRLRKHDMDIHTLAELCAGTEQERESVG